MQVFSHTKSKSFRIHDRSRFAYTNYFLLVNTRYYSNALSTGPATTYQQDKFMYQENTEMNFTFNLKRHVPILTS